MRAKLVHEEMAVPFTNPGNRNISSNYPLNRIQFEDVDKPDSDDWELPIPCPCCGKDQYDEDFIDGVCKKCAEQDIYFDRFGIRHKKNSRINKKTIEY